MKEDERDGAVGLCTTEVWDLCEEELKSERVNWLTRCDVEIKAG